MYELFINVAGLMEQYQQSLTFLYILDAIFNHVFTYFQKIALYLEAPIGVNLDHDSFTLIALPIGDLAEN